MSRAATVDPAQCGAFVGVSLDSDQFTREWVRKAIPYVLSRHPTLLFVLADRLLTFNKSTHQTGAGLLELDLQGANTRITKRYGDFYHFLSSEAARLPGEER